MCLQVQQLAISSLPNPHTPSRSTCACCRLLVDPAGAGGGGHQPVHPSLKAAVAWRYCQLLTALPNRGAEAAAWADAARGAWGRAGAGLQDRAIAGLLGDEAALKGQAQHGSGGVVSLVARRLLPPLV